MERYEQRSGKSQPQLWTWEVRGNSLVMSSCRAGDEPREVVVSFDSPEAALAAADTHVKKRIAKGYKRVDARTSGSNADQRPNPRDPRRAPPRTASRDTDSEERATLFRIHALVRRHHERGGDASWDALEALRREHPKASERLEQLVGEELVAGRFDDCAAPRRSGDTSISIVDWLHDFAQVHGRPDVRVFFHALATGRLRSWIGLFEMRREEAILHARAHLGDARFGHRRAAVEVMSGLRDVGGLPELEARAPHETAPEIAALIADTIRRFRALEEGRQLVPTEDPEEAADSVALSPEVWKKLVSSLREHHLAEEGWLAAKELSARTHIDEGTVRRAMAAVARRFNEGHLIDEEPFRGIRGRRLVVGANAYRIGSDRDTFFSLVPDAFALDCLVSEARYRDAERLLDNVGAQRPAGFDGTPPLFWRDGSPLSPGATSFYLRQLVAGAAFDIVDRGLTDACRLDLGRYILDPASPLPRKLREWVPTGCPALLHEVARLFDSGNLKRYPWAIGGFASSELLRWCYRWWCTRAANGLRDELRFQFESKWPTVDIECHFPEGPDPSGTESEWKGYIARVLERAMTDQRQFSFAHFRRCYLDNPLAASVLSGVVFRAGDHFVHFGDGSATGIRGRVDLDDSAMLTVAHPAAGTEHWPPGLPTPAFAQARRPIFSDVEPTGLEARKPIPHATWIARVRDLDYVGLQDTGGGVHKTFRWVFDGTNPRTYTTIEVHHNGYGAGYGGATAQTVTRASLTFDASPILRSEAAYDLRRLVGDLPIGPP